MCTALRAVAPEATDHLVCSLGRAEDSDLEAHPNNIESLDCAHGFVELRSHIGVVWHLQRLGDTVVRASRHHYVSCNRWRAVRCSNVLWRLAAIAKVRQRQRA